MRLVPRDRSTVAGFLAALLCLLPVAVRAQSGEYESKIPKHFGVPAAKYLSPEERIPPEILTRIREMKAAGLPSDTMPIQHLVVTNAGDEPDTNHFDDIFSPQTLRAAMENDRDSIFTIITFQDNVTAIGPHTKLPYFSNGLIDGKLSDGSLVLISGVNQGFATDPVFRISNFNGSATLKNLEIAHWRAGAIELSGGVVQGCVIHDIIGPGVILHTGLVGGDSLQHANIIYDTRYGTDYYGNYLDGSAIRLYGYPIVAGNYLGFDLLGNPALCEGPLISGENYYCADVIGNSIGLSNGQFGLSFDYQYKTIARNTIGTSIDGKTGLNTYGDAAIYAAAGDSLVVDGNLISGSHKDAIYIVGDNHVITNNIIGLDAKGTSVIGNGFDGETGSGIYQSNPAVLTTPFDNWTITGNVVSGNSGYGMRLGYIQKSWIQSNKVGTDITGSVALGNARSGIWIQGWNNVVGGFLVSEGNIISGNEMDGIRITNVKSNENVISQNSIGTDSTVTVALPNNRGVVIRGGKNNIIRDNYVSGNLSDGVVIDARSDTVAHTRLFSNHIGIGDNLTDLGNGGDGVNIIEAHTTEFGDISNVSESDIPAGNEIGFNDEYGVHLEQGADSTRFGTGTIGLGRFNESPAPNDSGGVLVENSMNVQFGPDPSILLVSHVQPVIGFNHGPGVTLRGDSSGACQGTEFNLINIGIGVEQSVPVPNDGPGIWVDNVSQVSFGAENTLGVIDYPVRIGGNHGPGIAISGPDAISITIHKTAIGVLPADSLPVPNDGSGIEISGGAGLVHIGDAADETDPVRNLIADNRGHGILIRDGSADNFIHNNSIFANDGHGIFVEDGKRTEIGDPDQLDQDVLKNRIHNNVGAGISVAAGSGITIADNAIMRNGILAIDLGNDGPSPIDDFDADKGANTLLNAPVLTQVKYAEQHEGTVIDGVYHGEPNTTLELTFFESRDFYPDINSGQSEEYFDDMEITTDENGDAEFSYGSSLVSKLNAYFSALATEPTLGNTSEFSNSLSISDLAPADLAASFPEDGASLLGDITPKTYTITNTSAVPAQGVVMNFNFGENISVNAASCNQGAVTLYPTAVQVDIPQLPANTSVDVDVDLFGETEGPSQCSLNCYAKSPDPDYDNNSSDWTLWVGPTLAAETPSELPKHFAVESIAPNPFNTTTTIRLALPEQAHLKTVVYNLLGRRVITLADKNFSTGRHTLIFDGHGLASGIYFVHVQVPGKLNEMRKIVLLR